VATIVSAVARGRCALLDYARRSIARGPLEVPRDEIEELAARVPPRVRAAIAAAARNIEKVARRQRRAVDRDDMRASASNSGSRRSTRVGCYVPGGAIPFPPRCS
jgi:histidinol dehydrogenase